MEKKVVELVFNKVRYEHLKENLGDRVTFIGYHNSNEDLPEDYFVKFEIEFSNTLDILDFYHTGLKFGLGVGLGKIKE